MKAPNPLSKMFAANHFTMIGAENSMATLFEPITKKHVSKLACFFV